MKRARPEHEAWRGPSAHRVSERELDRRLRETARYLAHDGDAETAAALAPLAAAVRTAIHRLFPLHCAGCGELPHEGRRCRRRSP